MPESEAPKKSSPLTFILRLVFGIAVLGFVLSRIDFSTVTLTVGPRLIGGVAFATLLLLVGQIVAALRWKTVWGEGSPDWMYLSRLYLIGGFFSLFLPTSVGGDAVRAAAATQASGRPGAVLASVLLDRFLGTIALFVYGIVGLLLAPALPGGCWRRRRCSSRPARSSLPPSQGWCWLRPS